MKHVFIAHPLGASTKEEIDANLERAVRWYEWCCDHYSQYSFDGTWMLNCQVYDDTDEQARAIGIRRSLNILERCDELWLCGGEVTTGMACEITMAKLLRVSVFDLTSLGAEPPVGPLMEAAV
jgi:hypothetical protein